MPDDLQKPVRRHNARQDGKAGKDGSGRPRRQRRCQGPGARTPPGRPPAAPGFCGHGSDKRQPAAPSASRGGVPRSPLRPLRPAKPWLRRLRSLPRRLRRSRRAAGEAHARRPSAPVGPPDPPPPAGAAQPGVHHVAAGRRFRTARRTSATGWVTGPSSCPRPRCSMSRAISATLPMRRSTPART